VNSTATINVALILGVALGWGLLGTASKAMFAAEPPMFDGFTVAAARAAWAFPVFAIALPVVWRIERPQLRLRQSLGLAGAGLVFGLIAILFSMAAQHTSVAHLAFFLGISSFAPASRGAIGSRSPSASSASSFWRSATRTIARRSSATR
jgi:drug/metabolite transporter (DMT)-like permease